MEIRVKKEGRSAEIFLKGELDHHGAKGLTLQLEREIEVLLPLRLILDFTDVMFMDSSGIAVVLRTDRRMKELGGSISLRGLGQQPRKLLEAAGINRMVEME